MSIATVGSHLIHYEVLGRGHPVLFIHGWIGSWRYWWPSMQHLSRTNRAFAFDLWGYGNSTKDPSHYSFESYVRMIAQLFDRLGVVSPVTLVGHGLGAAVALRYAVESPERVQRIAAVALPLDGGQINERLVDSKATDLVSRVLGRNSSFPEIDGELGKTDSIAVNTVARELLAYDFAADLTSATCPVLMICGAQDSVIRQPAPVAAAPVPQPAARHVVMLEGCAHFPMLEEPAKFNRLLTDFLRADGTDLTEIAPKELWRRRTR